MTLEEAKKVADIISEADSGCSNCVKSLIEITTREFPQWNWFFDGERAQVSEINGTKI